MLQHTIKCDYFIYVEASLCDKCRWVCHAAAVEGMECVVIVVVLACVVAVGADASIVKEVDVVLYVVALEDVACCGGSGMQPPMPRPR